MVDLFFFFFFFFFSLPSFFLSSTSRNDPIHRQVLYLPIPNQHFSVNSTDRQASETNTIPSTQKTIHRRYFYLLARFLVLFWIFFFFVYSPPSTPTHLDPPKHHNGYWNHPWERHSESWYVFLFLCFLSITSLTIYLDQNVRTQAEAQLEQAAQEHFVCLFFDSIPSPFNTNNFSFFTFFFTRFHISQC